MKSASARMLEPALSLRDRKQVEIDEVERQPVHDVFDFALDGVDQVRRATGDEEVDVGVNSEIAMFERADQAGFDASTAEVRNRSCSGLKRGGFADSQLFRSQGFDAARHGLQWYPSGGLAATLDWVLVWVWRNPA